MARLREFYRDKTGLSWNLLMPFLILVGFSFLFDDQPSAVLSIGILADSDSVELQFQGVDLVEVTDKETGILQVQRHQLDMLLEPGSPGHYWTNEYSNKSAIAEQLLLSKGALADSTLVRESVQGESIRYVDWVVPGVLSMNLMFSCLWGIGWVVVRYRKNGVLRRLQATPLTALEFLSAQVIARLIIVVVVTLIVYTGAALILDFTMRGSHLALALVFFLGSTALTSMGLLIAARLKTEEVADGVLNLLSWPMMMLSGVWFSMENAHPVAQGISQMFPLTHMVNAARRVMLDGVGVMGVIWELGLLSLITVVLMLLSARLFRWS